jgi:broad specificity phosphatase PhoE
LQLDIIRHGLTVSNQAHRFNDSDDDPLVAPVTGVAVDPRAYDQIFVSPALRCQETARGLGLTAWRNEPRLLERRLGVFQGLTPDQCPEQHGPAFAAFQGFDADFVIPDGESRAQHFQRIRHWLDEVETSGARRVLGVSHGVVVDFLYRLGSGLPLHGGTTIFGGDNLGRSRLERVAGVWRLLAHSEPLSVSA